MALYKQAQFADLIGKSSAHVSMAVRREQLVRNNKKEIDISHPVNSAWLGSFIEEHGYKWTNDGRLQDKDGNLVTNKKKKQAIKASAETEAPKNDAAKPLPKIKDLTGEEDLEEMDTTGMDADEEDLMGMDIQNVRRIEVIHRILKLREDTALAKIKKEKAEGELIPTEEVKFLFIRHTKTLSGEFENGLNSMLNDIAQRYKLTGEEQARYKGMVIDTLNKANVDAANATKRDLDKIISESSDKRGRGDKK